MAEFLVTAMILASAPVGAQSTRQEHVHEKSRRTMPFDLLKTAHAFKMTEFGGVRRVVAKDEADKDQTRLIQQHLHREAERFQKGEFSDPEALRGTDLPG